MSNVKDLVGKFSTDLEKKYSLNKECSSIQNKVSDELIEILMASNILNNTSWRMGCYSSTSVANPPWLEYVGSDDELEQEDLFLIAKNACASGNNVLKIFEGCSLEIVENNHKDNNVDDADALFSHLKSIKQLDLTLTFTDISVLKSTIEKFNIKVDIMNLQSRINQKSNELITLNSIKHFIGALVK